MRAGRVLTAPHLGTELWAGFDLQKALTERWRKPVRVMNDADVAGFGLHPRDEAVVFGRQPARIDLRIGDQRFAPAHALNFRAALQRDAIHRCELALANGVLAELSRAILKLAFAPAQDLQLPA